jgi:hypothetical protein
VTEVLEQEPSRLPLWSWLVVGLLVLGLVAAGVEDRQAHAAESSHVDRCAAGVLAARSAADQRVGAMASYVRPAFDGSYTERVRRGLARFVGRVARRSAPALDAARTTCARVDVRPWHGDLGGRLDSCLTALDAEQHWLADVARDGATAFRATADAPTGCTSG